MRADTTLSSKNTRTFYVLSVNIKPNVAKAAFAE